MAGASRRLEEVALTADEVMALDTLQCLVAARDLAAVTSPSSRPVKAGVLAAMLFQLREAAASQQPSWWDPGLDAQLGDDQYEVVLQTIRAIAVAAGASIARRSRAISILVDLIEFDPWPKGHPWVGSARRATIEEATDLLIALAPADLDEVRRELEAVKRDIARKQVRWGRVAAVGAVGLGLGAVSMGLAAPIIGATIGAASGLSGAAATSAGLATLGGGSLAAGGFGIAGGTAMLAGVGALTGLSAGATGARATKWASPAQITIDALKAAVLVRLVVRGEEHDEEKAKRVVEALQDRLEEVSEGLNRLAERIRELKREKAEIAAENDDLRIENTRLLDELAAEQDAHRLAQAALEVAIQHITVDAPGEQQ